MGVENGVPDLLEQLGTELHDLDLSESVDGRISRAWWCRTVDTGVGQVFRRLRSEHVDPILFKQAISLTVDANDSSLYPLNRRVRQIIRVFDDNNGTEDADYTDFRPLSTYDTGSEGWILEPDGIRLRGDVTLTGTLKAWVIQAPARLNYGTCAAGSDDTHLVLASAPDIGSSSVEPNYYVGARFAFEDGSAAGDVRRVTAYTASSRQCTVAAWSGTPTPSTDVYTSVMDLPDCMARAAILRASLIILRADKSMDRELDDVVASYDEAFRSGVGILRNTKIGFLPRFRQVWRSGFEGM